MLELFTAHDEQTIFLQLIEQIRSAAANGERGQILLVPDQYSHYAERLLCQLCPDDICLFAEVLSFRRLASRVFELSGSLARRPIDEGARLLTMAAALNSVKTRLSYFSASGLRPEVCKKLLSAVKELKNAEISPQQLSDTAESAEGPLCAKLNDMALIYSAYDALHSTAIDSDDELTMLADALELSPFANGRSIYIAGFTDFTAQQLRAVKNLILSAQKVTVGLTVTSDRCVQKKTAARLENYAAQMQIPFVIASVNDERERCEELKYLSRNLHDQNTAEYEGANNAVFTASVSNMEQECGLAASIITTLAREQGYRMRDFIVTARGFDKYKSILGGVFEKNGIPLYTGTAKSALGRSELLFGVFAAKIITSGYEYEDVFSYLKTGLTGLSSEETDLLENYVIQWDIRGAKWKREDDWHFHPNGKSVPLTDKDKAAIIKINELRNRVRIPLLAFEKNFSQAKTAEEFCLAVYELLEAVALRETLQNRYEALYSIGQREQAEEYRQLWDIQCRALDQFVDAAGDMHVTAEEFISFYKVLISDYSAGVIPVGVDSVNGSELTRLRAQRCKCLIILGATDTALPSISDDSSIFTERERTHLRKLGIELSCEDISDIEREFDNIDAALDVPSHKLYILYPTQESATPSFVLQRANKMFENAAMDSDYTAGGYMAQTEQGIFELACHGVSETASPLQEAAYSALENSERLNRVILSSKDNNSPLSKETVKNMYGSRLWLTPSRVEKFRSCKFSYFMQFGLKARPRINGAFEAQDAGIFMHYILQNVCERAKANGGFASTSPEETAAWTREFTKRYADEYLDGFRDKSARFIYLFERLARSAVRIVEDLSDELRHSSFEPLAFELNFGPGQDVDAIEPEDSNVAITGIADRVDGWMHDGKLYLRIIDYKTGHKTFDLGDVWNGLSLQMLIYLFALQKNGTALFDAPIVPAGILYMPARDPIIRTGADRKPEKAEADRKKELKRSGILIEDKSVLRAMEHDFENGAKYLPLTVNKSGNIVGSTASLSKLRKLSRFVDDTLKKIGEEIADGRVETDPYFSGPQSACDWCDYKGSCRFEKTKRGVRHLKRPNAELFWEELDRRYSDKTEVGK